MGSFEPAKGVDVLVVVRGNATQATDAKRAAILIGFGATSGFVGDIGLVDAKTGEVLAWARMSYWGDVSKDPDVRFVNCTRDALRDIPFPAPPTR